MQNIKKTGPNWHRMGRLQLQGEAGEMVTESAVNTSSELRKRRSTRIVQAVPLTVTGVDALGRPFAERTSTLIINCHGCRYQSKHYVLKNMWVNLGGAPPGFRAFAEARARQGGVDPAATDGAQLFQVALELEQAGNAWGIAFPPDDWFVFPEEPSFSAGGGFPPNYRQVRRCRSREK